MNPRTIEGPMIEMSLRQYGASNVKSINGVQYHIVFELENGFDVSYVYNINGDNEYFLQRVSPYPMHHGIFDNEQQLVDYIKEDIHKFKVAIRSSNFKHFVKVTNKIQDLTARMEILFLNYNVDSSSLIALEENFDHLMKDIHEIALKSKKIDD